MNKISRVTFILWLTIGGWLLSVSAAETTLSIRADAWMPFNGDPKSATPGYVVELARLIFEPTGVKIDYELMPWKDALTAARAGQIDAVIGANPTEAEGLLLPTAPVGMPRVGLFVKKSSTWKYENIQSLSSVRTGVIAGYSYWDSFDSYVKKNHEGKVVVFEGEKPLADGIAKLEDGSIDVMAETMAVFVWTTRSLGGKAGDYRSAYLQSADPIYMAFAKNKQGLRYAKIFDEGLERLRKNGELEAILKKYGLTDWE